MKRVVSICQRRLSTPAARQGFGSFHSEDIEVLVRTPQLQLPDRLEQVRNQTTYEIDDFCDKNSNFIRSSHEQDKSRTLRKLFSLSNDFTFLNHGAFGGALQALSSEGHRWRLECEKQPLRFFDRDLFPLLAFSLQEMGKVLGCDAEDLLPLPNVTTGLNALTHSVHLETGDEIMLFSLTYGSTKKIVKDWALRQNAVVNTVSMPFPILSNDDVVTRISNALSPRTKVIIIDQITSNTALNLPVKEIAHLCKSHNPNICVIVDAAHALFSQPILIQGQPSTKQQKSLTSNFQNVDFWLTNAHKWFSAPKGAALLWSNPHTVHQLRPAIISHGFTPAYDRDPRTTMLSRNKFLSGFAWDGCRDYAALLTLPSAIAVWNRLEKVLSPPPAHSNDALTHPWQPFRNKTLATLQQAETIFRKEWDLQETDFPCPQYMRHTSPMRLIPLPKCVAGQSTRELVSDNDAFRLQETLHHQHRIEVPVKCLEGKLYIRISAHVYNHVDEYEKLAKVINSL